MGIKTTKTQTKEGVISIRRVPGELLRRIRVQAAGEGKDIRVFVMDLLDRHVTRLPA
jgi:hypothetical protein